VAWKPAADLSAEAVPVCTILGDCIILCLIRIRLIKLGPSFLRGNATPVTPTQPALLDVLSCGDRTVDETRQEGFRRLPRLGLLPPPAYYIRKVNSDTLPYPEMDTL
jgi:hypothetical protein